MAAFTRADGVIEWAQELISAGRKQKLPFKAEENQMKQFARAMKDAKTKWHEFNLTDSRRSAYEVFRQATEVKDRIWKKLPA